MNDRFDVCGPCPAREGYAMPAEWAPHARTWMCWPCRVATWGSREALVRARQAFARVARVISTFEPVAMVACREDLAGVKLATGGKAGLFEAPLDDCWARDTGPTFVRGPSGRRGAVQWRFNAWGDKYAFYEEDARLAARIAEAVRTRLFAAPLVCEGGAFHTDGEGTLIATEQCLCNLNRNPDLSVEEVEERLMLFTGAQKVIWLGGGFSDAETDGHVDNIAGFASPGLVVVGVPSFASHPDYRPVKEAIRRLKQARDARGRRIEVVEIAQPRSMRLDGRGRPLQASYVNFYLPNGGVLLPAFDDPGDEAARAVMADCFPDREIVQIEARDIVEGGGGIHCITQQEPAP